jgi:hypothetical protein
MITPTTYQQWETAVYHMDQGLSLAKVLRELFSAWENEYLVGQEHSIRGLAPLDFCSVLALLIGELTQASHLFYGLETSCRDKEVQP